MSPLLGDVDERNRLEGIEGLDTDVLVNTSLVPWALDVDCCCFDVMSPSPMLASAASPRQRLPCTSPTPLKSSTPIKRPLTTLVLDASAEFKLAWVDGWLFRFVLGSLA